MLKPDPLSGDYAPNFFGCSWNTATYSVNDPQFGWLAFGGNVKKDGDVVNVTPLDSSRSRIYVASLALSLTLDAGTFERIEVNSKTGVIRLGLAAATSFTPAARLHVEQPALVDAGVYRPTASLHTERGAFVVALGRDVTWLELRPNSQ